MNGGFADSRIGNRGRGIELSPKVRERTASGDGRDVVAVEVFAAFFGSEVAGDAAAGERHQQVNVHGIDLDDSVVSRGNQAFAVGSPSDGRARDRCEPARMMSLAAGVYIPYPDRSVSHLLKPTRLPSGLTATLDERE